MTDDNRSKIRVLVVDDEPAVRDAYKQVLCTPEAGPEGADLRELRARLFRRAPGDTPAARDRTGGSSFDVVFCDQAESAIQAVERALGEDAPFAVVFLDMRMPPGKDGVWAAARIRELDPAIEIVICTAFSDVDPSEVGGIVPPEEKLSYLQKPFHPHEVRQAAIALASKWRAERRIVRLAYFDTLTGLPNREQSRSRLVGAIEAARVHKRMLAVLYLDLDNFKRVNDTLGHAAGDEVLKQAAQRIRSEVREVDTVARLGGDEFVVLLETDVRPDTPALIGERIRAGFQSPFEWKGLDVRCGASIGVSLYPDHAGDVASLMASADEAMYREKSAG